MAGSPTSNVTAMRSTSEFLGAEDIMGRGDVTIRIDEVLTYPEGYSVGGRKSSSAFMVLAYSTSHRDGWRTGKKRWILSSAEVRRTLMIIARSVHAKDWRGIVVQLFVEVCRSPKGGLTWGIRVRPPNKNEIECRMQAVADRLPPERRLALSPPSDAEPDDQPPEPPEPPPDAEDPDNYGDVYAGEDE